MSKPRFGLEAFKFGVYVSVPIFMTVVFAANPENLESIIKSHSYVVYPPEGPKPPTAKEMKRIVEANKKKRVDVEGTKSGWFSSG
jgi:protein PET100